MENLKLHDIPVADTGMLIRRPVAEVFEAIVNPGIITKFWFTKSSGRLEEGKTVEWHWEMYNVSAQVKVIAVKHNGKIEMDWGNDAAGYTRVEWIFTPYENTCTFLQVINSGFTGNGDEIVKRALDSTGGFTWVLAGLKAYLEHNIQLNLVADRFPKGLAHH
jgi:uncharacterized protein YndB with AHSA1/START domain